MAENQRLNCVGHRARIDRKQTSFKLLRESEQGIVESKTIIIRKGPSVSVETSLRELEDIYEKTPEWDLVSNGGVLSVPVEELRTTNLPKPGPDGCLDFSKMKKGAHVIQNFPVGQTIQNLKEEILAKYNQAREDAEASGKSDQESLQTARNKAIQLPQFKAVNVWLDINAEIRVKRELEAMMKELKIPAVIIRSIDMKELSTLKDLGLQIPKHGEIDLIMAYASGDTLRVVIFEVKRGDTYPWQTKPSLVSQKAINKAENQLVNDVAIMVALLAGVPIQQISVHTLACFPDTPLEDLRHLICDECLESSVICREDIKDRARLRSKTQVADVLPPSSTGMGHLLTLTARCLSQHSLLHLGHRDLADKEKVVTARHQHSVSSVDEKLKKKEFVIASPEQREVLRNFSSDPSSSHLLLEGPAGSGKTLVALEAAKSLLNTFAHSGPLKDGPLLIVTAGPQFQELKMNDPIMTYLNRCTEDIPVEKVVAPYRVLLQISGADNGFSSHDYGYSNYGFSNLIKALTNKWAQRKIILVIDEIIFFRETTFLATLDEITHTKSIQLILVSNPRWNPFQFRKENLPPNFLHVSLQTSYRSTISITLLARYLSKCLGETLSGGHHHEIGSDLEGVKPTFFDTGRGEDFKPVIRSDVKLKLKLALKTLIEDFGPEATILYNLSLNRELKETVTSMSQEGGAPFST